MAIGGTLADLKVRVDLDSKQFETGLSGIQGRLRGVSEGMIKTGGALTKNVTLPLLGIATAAIYTLSGFDDSMSKVQAISGATGDELDQLRDLAKDLGSTTRFAASEAADAMGYLALAGWDTNQIMAATPDMLNLAAAAGMDLATTADIVSDTMSAFQIEAEDAGMAADIFAAASSLANTNVHQLGEAMKYAGPAAAAAGMDMAQTSAVLGILADSGIKGSKAGTTLNAMFRDLRTEVVDGAVAIGDASVAIYDAEGNMRDLGSIMADVEDATRDMTTEQRDMALGAIFGEQAMKGVNIMLAEGSEKYKDLENSIYDSSGAADEMADIMEDNIGGALRALKSQFEGILIQLGEQLAPVIRETIIPLVQSFGERLSALIGWFANLDEGTRRTILTILGIVVALGPVMVIIGKLIGLVASVIGMVGKFVGILTWLGRAIRLVIGFFKLKGAALLALSGPIGWIIGAIIGLIAIGILLYKNWDKVKEFAINVWNSIADFFRGIWESITGIFSGGQGNILEGIASWLAGIRDRIFAIFKNILNWYIGIWDQILGVFGTSTDEIFGVVSDWLNRAWDVIKKIWDSIVSFFKDIWGAIKALFRGDLQAVSDHLNSAYGGMFDLTRSIWQAVLNFFGSIWQGILGIFRTQITNIQNFVTSIFTTIRNWLSGIWGSIRATALSIWQSLSSGVTQTIQNLRQTIMNIINGILNWLRGLPSQMLAIGRNMIQGMISGVRNMASGLVSAARGVVSGAVDAAKRLLRIGSDSKVFIELGVNTGSGFETGLERMRSNIQDKMENVVSPPEINMRRMARNIGRQGIQRFELADASGLGGRELNVRHEVDLKNVPDSVDKESLERRLQDMLNNPAVKRQIDRISFENSRDKI